MLAGPCQPNSSSIAIEVDGAAKPDGKIHPFHSSYYILFCLINNTFCDLAPF
jgi:hypothetical protein